MFALIYSQLMNDCAQRQGVGEKEKGGIVNFFFSSEYVVNSQKHTKRAG